MEILSLIYAVATSTIYILLYINLYDKYFKRKKTFIFGIIFFLLAIYLQFLTNYLNLDIAYVALLSFVSYPIAIYLIFKTNILHNIFLSLNAILKIYAAFILFGAIFASYNGVQYQASWLNTTHYFNLAQGSAYLLSIGSLLLNDKFLIKDKLKYFFVLKGYLVLLISIQIILIINLVWISVSNVTIPYNWYNNVLILTGISFDIIYFLLRLFTANSSYYSTFKGHTITLKKQLELQLDHYKTYESQMTSFLKYKHDYDKVLKGIANLLAVGDIDGVKSVLNSSRVDLDKLGLNYRKYSNNIILDALLNDYERRFKSIGSAFDCYIHFPIKDMKEIHLIKLFYNILENVYEALRLVPSVNDRLVNIKTSLVNNYIKFEFVNTMIEKDYQGITSKEDKISHGFGIQIIDEIINTYNGFSNRFSLEENNNLYYHFELFLPIN